MRYPNLTHVKCCRCHERFPIEETVKHHDKHRYCVACMEAVGHFRDELDVCIVCGGYEEKDELALCAFCGRRTARRSADLSEGYPVVEGVNCIE